MSVVSLITHNYSVLHKALIFLMRLAWKSRIRLPYLIMIGFMALDIRLTFEIVINVEHPPVENGYNPSGSSSDSEDSDDLFFKAGILFKMIRIIFYSWLISNKVQGFWLLPEPGDKLILSCTKIFRQQKVVYL